MSRLADAASWRRLMSDILLLICRGKKVKRSGYQMYAASKLMLYMFGVELQKRLRSVGSSTDIFSAHPGVAQTDAFRKSDKSKPMARLMASGADLIGQSASGGAQSLVRCATDPALTGQYSSAPSHMLRYDLHALLASKYELQLPLSANLCVDAFSLEADTAQNCCRCRDHTYVYTLGKSKPYFCLQYMCLCAGMGGGDRHWGSWYTGIPFQPFGSTWPLCFTVNWNNMGYRSPINPLIRDPEACTKLYLATLDLVNECAATKIAACGERSVSARSR